MRADYDDDGAASPEVTGAARHRNRNGKKIDRGGELSALMRDYWPALGGWACLIVASLIAFWLTEGTPYHQLAVGVMMSASTLFILMAIFECIWRLLVDDVTADDGPDRRRSGA